MPADPENTNRHAAQVEILIFFFFFFFFPPFKLYHRDLVTTTNDVDIPYVHIPRGNYYRPKIVEGEDLAQEVRGSADLLFLSDFLNCTGHERERCLRDVNEIMGLLFLSLYCSLAVSTM